MKISNYARPGSAPRNAPGTPGGSGGARTLDDLTDVDVPAPDDGDVLTFDDATGTWIASPPAGGPGGDASKSFAFFIS